MPSISLPEKMFRIWDVYSTDQYYTEEFLVLRATPCGVWIRDGACRSGERFVLLGEGRRYAYPTVELALDSYEIRKMRQEQHLRAQLDKVLERREFLRTGKSCRFALPLDFAEEQSGTL